MNSIFRDKKGKLHKEKQSNEFVPTIIMKDECLTELNLKKLSDNLYIDQDSNMIYVDDENNFLAQCTMDNTNLRDAVGTPCDGYFIKTAIGPGVDYYFEKDTPSIKASIQTTPPPAPLHISLIHNCATCGATLEIEENKPIFHCKYCGSTYVIGPAQIYSHY